MDSLPAEHLAAVTRRVNTTTDADTELRLLTLDRLIDAPLDTVWSALTEPTVLAQWLAPVTGDPEVGGRVELGIGTTLETTAEVLECVAPERFVLTWHHDDRTTRVDLSLRPVPGGTLVQLDHTVALDERWQRLGAAGDGIGWETRLAALATHLGGGSSTPTGGDLAAGSAAEWAAAAVADGDEPAAAHAAAQAAARAVAQAGA